MIKNIEYEKNGSLVLVVDSTELLSGRADMSDEPGEQKLQREELGGNNFKVESKLRKDKETLKWSEPDVKSLDVYHVCPICGTKFRGRTNRIYCCPRCKKTAEVRRYRKRKRDLRDFKPHRGHAGEVYILCDVKGKDVISFIPAFYGDTRARAKKYIEDTYPVDKVDNYFEQVKEVVKK